MELVVDEAVPPPSPIIVALPPAPEGAAELVVDEQTPALGPTAAEWRPQWNPAEVRALLDQLVTAATRNLGAAYERILCELECLVPTPER